MDDDLSFGASVWGAPASPYALKPIAPAFSTTTSSQDGFDDFDAFGAPEETPATSGDDADDDFGDFGDFGQPQEMGDVSAFGDEDAFGEEVRIPRPGPSSADWEPLRLDSLSSKQDLQEQVDELLGPLWATIDESQLFDEDIRQAGGLNQTLTTRESRDLFQILLPSAPHALPPVNWTRSRIRRRHLISLGIPVNLDEVLPKTNGRLPALEITTRPMSAPPGPRTAPVQRSMAGAGNPQAGMSRPGTPRPATPKTSVGATSSVAAQLRLGPRPELDESKVTELLALDPDNLTLLPISALEKYSADLQMQTINTSSVLTHLLQTRDALRQDSETYNKLIGELVGEAQKIKTGKRVAGGKRSTMT
ncbi:hypothetical protein IEO21_00736 [Rhodonia placenta]|uniref:Uncharacterized protein n=1 Tax=Rhodonia placenta TaxID=104341 RepID=A0A8H7PBL6_9APHY|nr:hypothetical protein IEO21_00736 [Postia placenta]